MSRDPLVDMRDREDSREAYLDGWVTREPWSKHYSPALVRTDLLFGDPTACWCGEQALHDWPGKAAGEHHPRKALT